MARSDRRRLPWPRPAGPNWNATTSTHGRASSTPNIAMVRRRRNCRTNSTRSGSVRPGA
ncbi:hypothetical protein ACQP2K_32735 [Microbispora siamensis]